jgi:hypothetical protein
MQKAARVKVAWGGARSVHGGVGMHATSADFHVGVVSGCRPPRILWGNFCYSKLMSL